MFTVFIEKNVLMPRPAQFKPMLFKVNCIVKTAPSTILMPRYFHTSAANISATHLRALSTNPLSSFFVLNSKETSP